MPCQQAPEGFVFPTALRLCACLAVWCWGAALCLPVASISPWPRCLFPTSVLSCVLVSVQHRLDSCPFLAPGPEGFCLESQEGVSGQCWVSPQQHGQSCLLAACPGFWMMEGIPGGSCLPSASGLGTGWNRRLSLRAVTELYQGVGCSLFSLLSPSELAAHLVTAGHLAGKVPPALRLTD